MMTSKRFFSVTIRAGLINRGLSQICDTTPSSLPTLHLQGFHTGRLKESTQLVFLPRALYPPCSMFCKYRSHAPSHPHARPRHTLCHAHPASVLSTSPRKTCTETMLGFPGRVRLSSLPRLNTDFLICSRLIRELLCVCVTAPRDFSENYRNIGRKPIPFYLAKGKCASLHPTKKKNYETPQLLTTAHTKYRVLLWRGCPHQRYH